MQILRPVLATASCAAALALGSAEAQAANCATGDAEPVNAVRRMYAAAMDGDRAKMIAAFDAEGFLFDGGRRFTPEAIADSIVKIEAAGTKPQWNVEGSESHTACDLAWATWTNRGTFTSATGSELRTWLESAVFVWRNGAWKIRFFHSTPVAPANSPRQP